MKIEGVGMKLNSLKQDFIFVKSERANLTRFFVFLAAKINFFVLVILGLLVISSYILYFL
jgi:hypothetical protein